MVKKNDGKISRIDARSPQAVNLRACFPRKGAISSAVEHCLHTAGVAGSNPASPTIFSSTYSIQNLLPTTAVLAASTPAALPCFQLISGSESVLSLSNVTDTAFARHGAGRRGAQTGEFPNHAATCGAGFIFNTGKHMGLRFWQKRFRIKNHHADSVSANLVHHFRWSPVFTSCKPGLQASL